MPQSDEDVRAVLENGIREISGEVRNSLDFHRSQDEGGQVSHVVLSGAVLDLPGFAAALQTSLGFEVRSDAVGVADPGPAARSPPAASRWPPAWPVRRRRNESRQPDPARTVALERRPASGRSGGAAYAVLAVLGGLAILALLYGIAHHQISDRRSRPRR